MIELATNLFIAILGLAGGLAVGSGLVALLIVFDLIPRLAQLARAYRMSKWFETAIVSGSLYWTFADFMDWKFSLQSLSLISIIGLFDGLFVGMLAAALTEVMNVLPILAKRMKLSKFIASLVMAMVLGKTLGSLFDWLVFQW
ncbi:stage V sporulation protein AB [Paenibacillus sp. GSMTC-2017]|uniref:stage V sporulation protein AB n=1 Tax=Paenibacillus sp. GSMTC-2017 TaxID=2794350 RepID=UPI0018D5C577|nr:stage V sporulation protein AB [Paenibacillus sp. GSMTC-2017]MBH5318015.1 stage V sporulation protein AB [Paenibacillus sp. GSMTC-2017]